MRKVKYWVWLTAAQSHTGKSMLSDERIGYFHQWGSEINESLGISETVGIVEDEKTKGISKVYPHHIQFID